MQATPAVAKWHGSINLKGGVVATLHGALITAPWVRGLRAGFSRSCVLPITSDQNGPINCYKNFWLFLATVLVGGGGAAFPFFPSFCWHLGGDADIILPITSHHNGAETPAHCLHICSSFLSFCWNFGGGVQLSSYLSPITTMVPKDLLIVCGSADLFELLLAFRGGGGLHLLFSKVLLEQLGVRGVAVSSLKRAHPASVCV